MGFKDIRKGLIPLLADDFMRFLKENEVEVLDSNLGKRILYAA